VNDITDKAPVQRMRFVKNEDHPICFATMAKNEEHCIERTLESVAPHVGSIVFCDTGSTDRTVEIVRAFCKSREIDLDLWIDEWHGFDVSKSRMMRRAQGRATYILHFDADDVLDAKRSLYSVAMDAGNQHDLYFATLRRGSLSWQATILYRGDLRWRFVGVAHTIVKCDGKPRPSFGTLDAATCSVIAEEIGSRALDPSKYRNDALALARQFEDTRHHDPDEIHTRSAFYAGQSFLDAGIPTEAERWYRIFLSLPNTWREEVFEAHLRIARCQMATRASIDLVQRSIDDALAIFPDRAEPAFWFGVYANQHKDWVAAYRYLTRARACSIEAARATYVLFLQDRCYGKHANEELAVACYWLGKSDEGRRLLDTYQRSSVLYNLEQYRARTGRLGQKVDDSPPPHVAAVAAVATILDEIIIANPSVVVSIDGKPMNERNPRPVTSSTVPIPPETIADWGNVALGKARPEIVVVDNFYADPAMVRALALTMPFVASPAHHKGRRTPAGFRPSFIRGAIQDALGRTITRWDYPTNGVFQACTAEDALVYHTDVGIQTHAAIVYLSPDAPPECGTSFFRSKATGLRYAPDERAAFAGGYYDRSRFERVDDIGNVFNRLIIWDATMIHAAAGYFGNNLETARLFQLFFFDT
jgi:hypothetical protein